MPDTDLRVNIEAKGVSLEQLQATLSALQKQQQQFAASSTAASRAASAAIQSHINAVQAQIGAYKQLTSAVNETAVTYRTLQESLALNSGANIDRQFKSAADSAKVFASSLSAVAEADSRARDANVANALALNDVAVASEKAAAATRTYGRASASSVGSAAAFREGRHVVALFDELSRGQRGAMFSSLGAMARDAGLGVAGLSTGIGGLVAVMGSRAILHAAENMGKWAAALQAGASATGMSLEQFSRLSGAMDLIGAKEGEADSALRRFASNINTALANPASKAAQAFKAVFGSLEPLKSGDTYQIFLRTADALNSWGNNASKAAAMAQLFGRASQKAAELSDQGSAAIVRLGNTAAEQGLVPTKQLADQLVRTGENVRSLGASIKGDAMAAFEAWEPLIDSITTSLGTLSEAALKAIGVIGKFATSIPHMIPDMEQGTSNDLSYWWDFITKGPKAAEANLRHKLSSSRSGTPGGAGGATNGNAASDIPLPSEKPFPVWGQKVTPQSKIDAKATALDRAEMRLQVAEARDNAQQISEAYDELLSRLAARYGTDSAQFKLAEAEKVQAANRAADQIYSAHMRAAKNQAQLQSDNTRVFRIQMEEMVRTHQISSQQAAGFSMQALGQNYAQQSAALQSVAPYANTAAQKQQLAAAQRDLYASYVEQMAQLQEQWAAAGEKSAEAYLKPFEQGFDALGNQIESTIGSAIKSAFIPMKPEYWISSLQGPHGQPLMQYHRINPAMQLLGNLGTSALGDIGKTGEGVASTFLTQSLVKSGLFAPGTTSISQGLAGGLMHLFSGGKGAASAAPQQQFQTAVQQFGQYVQQLASSGAAKSGASTAVTSTSTTVPGDNSNPNSNTSSATNPSTVAIVGAVGAAGTLISSAVGGTAGRIIAEIVSAAQLIFTGLILLEAKPSVLGTTYSFGGIVPSAAGGMVVGGTSGGIPSILHPREMVLPSHLSEGIQRMLGPDGRGSGATHLHLHSQVMDAPSLERWFRSNMAKNSSAVKEMFRYHALNPSRMWQQ